MYKRQIHDLVFEDCDIIHCQYEGNMGGAAISIHQADGGHVHDIQMCIRDSIDAERVNQDDEYAAHIMAYAEKAGVEISALAYLSLIHI